MNRSFAHFLTKNEQLARKSNERIPRPGAETAILDYEYGISYRLIRMDGSVDYALLVSDQGREKTKTINNNQSDLMTKISSCLKTL